MESLKLTELINIYRIYIKGLIIIILNKYFLYFYNLIKLMINKIYKKKSKIFSQISDRKNKEKPREV